MVDRLELKGIDGEELDIFFRKIVLVSNQSLGKSFNLPNEGTSG